MTISSQTADRILLLVEAAKANGSLITVREMLPLLPEETTEVEVAEAVSSRTALGTRVEIRSGFVTDKGEGNGATDLVSVEVRNRQVALKNLSFARRFSRLLRAESHPLVAVSGSTSYLSSSKSTDIDFFCVAKTGTLWIQLTSFLILARAYRLLRRGTREVCFSCIMDEKYADRVFAETRDPLFARDALQAAVLNGDDYYRGLLGRAVWISTYYPTLYRQKAGSGSQYAGNPTSPPTRKVVVNRLLFILVGSYLRMKSFLNNKRMAKRNERHRGFRLRAGHDHMFFESTRYQSLRERYLAEKVKGRGRSNQLDYDGSS